MNWQDIQPVFTDTGKKKKIEFYTHVRASYTDSLMLAVGGDGTLESVVRPDRRALFERLAPRFLDAYAPASRPVRLGLWANGVSSTAAGPITGCVALGSKVYAYRQQNGKETVRCKSVPVKNNERLLTFENYLEAAADPFGVGARGRQAELRNMITRHGQTCTVVQQRTCLRGFLRKSKWCESLLHSEGCQD